MDKLKIHGRRSLPDFHGAETGNLMGDRVTGHYTPTPTQGSWLKQAEIEISLFSRHCLGRRRIPSLRILRQESRAGNRRISRTRTKLKWKFDRRAARRQF